MKYKQDWFYGCSINALGTLVDKNNIPVRLDVREFDVASFEIRTKSGTYATAVLSLQAGNSDFEIPATATTYTAPSAHPRIKHTGAIDVTAYAYIGLEVTTAEGGAGLVDVLAIAKSKYT